MDLEDKSLVLNSYDTVPTPSSARNNKHLKVDVGPSLLSFLAGAIGGDAVRGAVQFHARNFGFLVSNH
jgi:hypothetical protein